MASTNCELEKKCQPTSVNIKTCLGKVLTDLNCIIHCYNCVKLAIGYTIGKLMELEEEINSQCLKSTLDEETKDFYFCLIKELRKQINNQTTKKTVCDQICIPQEEETLIFKCGEKNLCFKVPPFLSMHFLQATNEDHEYLFFQKSPECIPYDQNRKLTIEMIPEGAILHPVWYYMFDNKISTNYSYLLNTIDDDITYSELLDYRLLLKDDIQMKCKMSVEACGKYKFHFMKDECKICLPDPECPDKKISPKRQGAIDGLFSFVESIDCYNKISEGSIAINNTIIVLKKLESLLCKLIEQMEDLKQKICCAC